jgi:Holliday junction resolvase-like predicted endonuclease
MFQAGYLTISGYDQEQELYKLGYPNCEVQKALQVYLLEALTRLDYPSVEHLSAQLRTAFNRYAIEDIVDVLRQLFAHVPYQLHMKEEKFYHALLQMACTAAGLKAQSEYSTSHGRIDLVVQAKKLLYVIEIKFNQSADIALTQIKERRYYERFLHQGKKIILLGLAFIRAPLVFDIVYATQELL